MSCVMCQMLKKNGKRGGANCQGSVINGAYPVYFSFSIGAIIHTLREVEWSPACDFFPSTCTSRTLEMRRIAEQFTHFQVQVMMTKYTKYFKKQIFWYYLFLDWWCNIQLNGNMSLTFVKLAGFNGWMCDFKTHKLLYPILDFCILLPIIHL